MSEVEKMYENVEVKKQIPKICSSNELYCKECEAHIEDAIPYCKNAEYPPFTAEKQIAIFKIFCKRYLEVSQHVEENGDLCFGIKATVGDFAVGFNKDFAECLADFVNYLWQDLTEEEKEEIKRILEDVK